MWKYFRKTIWGAAGMICGNFLIQLFEEVPNMAQAMDRAIFQTAMYIFVMFLLWIED